MFRKATFDDLNKIMTIIAKTISDMRSYNSDQWSDDYPKEQVFIEDINEICRGLVLYL